MVKEKIKRYNLTLDENVVKELQDFNFNISKIVRKHLKEKLIEEKKKIELIKKNSD